MSPFRRLLRAARRFAKRGLRPLTHRWLTRRRLAAGLPALGVRRGGILLVHSSLSALGYVPGGPPAVLAALREAVGPEGTLVLPSHSWQQMEAGCRTFDAARTPCCVGEIAEAWRKTPGVLRSLHPTHAVAAHGPLAAWLVEGHEDCPTPCGSDTPYAKALARDCQVLFLGIGLEYNTAYHTLEAEVEVPYLLNDEPDEFTIIDAAGAARRRRVLRHRAGVPRRFPATEALLVERGVARRGHVGHVPCLLLEGRPFLERILPLLRESPSLLAPPAPASGGAGGARAAAPPAPLTRGRP